MSHGILIARGLGLVMLVAATGYSLQRVAFLPLRCVHAASLDAAALNATERNDDMTQRMALRVRADLEGCQSVSLADVRVPFTLGTASAAAGDARAAIAQYQRALEIDRRPEIYLALGLAQLEALDRSAAIESFVRACTFDPARFSEIPYEEIKQETEQRIRARYGPDWVR
jgi:tetratricopeptide (TPR) repeat protein